MKKFLAFTLMCLLILSSAGFAMAAAVTNDEPTAPAAAEQYKLYLVPGTYVSAGSKVANTISSGATKLSQEDCDAIFTDNAYLCTLDAGAALPTPTSGRVDKEGNPYTFNGWWAIVDATVTYFDKVPTLSENMFLYADWRADLTQRRDPIDPDDEEAETLHYMEVKRATGETDKIILRPGSTSMPTAETLGYGYPVELSAIKFELRPGDEIKVYTIGLLPGDEPQLAPIARSSSDHREISLESSTKNGNVTANYLTATVPSYWRGECEITCTADVARYYNIYIKFFSGGTTMAIYMEPTP